MKIRRRAITLVMVECFANNARVVAEARGLSFARLQIVAPKGIRPDASTLAHAEGMLASGLRSLE